jgi:hypothetical protein
LRCFSSSLLPLLLLLGALWHTVAVWQFPQLLTAWWLMLMLLVHALVRCCSKCGCCCCCCSHCVPQQ